jgi:2-methylcitrate dehydratase PrpD
MSSTATDAEAFVAFAKALRFQDIPPAVVEATRLHVLDTLGCGLAASGLDEGRAGRTVADAAGGAADASVIGASRRVPAPEAALANGMLCHALDFDDTHPTGGTHISAVAVPSALAAAEAAGADGRDLVVALVAATEFVARLAMTAPAGFHARGFHPTSVCGVFGAATAAGLLWELPEQTLTSALGLATSMASGVFAYLQDGTPTKPLHAGVAAHNGLLAARLAAAGASGPRSSLEARYGLYDSFVGGPADLGPQLADLGERWETLRIAYKTLPACHAMHAVLAALADLRRRSRFSARDVDHILVRVPAPLADLVLDPLDVKRTPRNGYDAKFSLPYSIASTIVRDRTVTLRDYADEVVGDPDVTELAARVSYQTADFASYPRSLPGAIDVRLIDGSVLKANRDAPDGSPEYPLESEAVLAKFRANAALAIPAAAADALAQRVLALDELTDVREMTKQLRQTA